MKQLTLQKAAKQIIKALKAQGIVIQRYDAYSTNSIYLKLDFGASQSIRISDHEGKKHLSYRYNLVKGCTTMLRCTANGWERYYYSLEDIDQLIEQVVQDRKFKLACFGESEYKLYMMQKRADNKNAPGFWRQAKLV